MGAQIGVFCPNIDLSSPRESLQSDRHLGSLFGSVPFVQEKRGRKLPLYSLLFWEGLAIHFRGFWSTEF